MTDGPKSVLLPIPSSVRGRPERQKESRLEKKKKKKDRGLQQCHDKTSKTVGAVFRMWEPGKSEVACSREFLMTRFMALILMCPSNYDTFTFPSYSM